MNWLAKTLLVVLVCSGLAAVACGESIYMNRGPSLDMAYNVLEARDASTAAVGTSYTTASGYKRAGIGLSPDETILYTAAYSATNNNTELWSYNAATGAYIGSVTVSSGILCRGLAVDPDTGNVYVSLTGSIAQITPSGDVNTSWGTGLTVADLEIYDGKLYGGGYQTGTKGVYWWDLNAGGSGGGAASVLNGTIDTAVYGLAFAPDGTLFTGINAGKTSLRQWDSNYENPTYIGSFRFMVQGDVDFINGNLYATGRYEEDGYVVKIDAATGDTSTWVSFSSDGEGSTPDYYPGWLAGEAVPEPSTFALLATGLIGLLAYALRKRK